MTAPDDLETQEQVAMPWVRRSIHVGRAVDIQQRLEDITFLRSSGATFEGIAARLEVTPDALYRWLHRNGMDDLYEQLRRVS